MASLLSNDKYLRSSLGQPIFSLKYVYQIRFNRLRLFICFILLLLIFIQIYSSSWSSLFFNCGENPTECFCDNYSEDPAAVNAKEELDLVDPYSNLSSWDSVERHHPNFPLHLLRNTQKRCNLLPSVFRLTWVGVHWQQMIGAGGETYLLYSAFYDNRTKSDPAGGSVRILALVNSSLLFFPRLPWCHLWYEGQQEPVPSRVVRAEYIDWQWRSTERLMSFLLTCPVAARAGVPVAVSLVARPCTPATNALKVVGKPDEMLGDRLNTNPDYKNSSSPSWRVGVCGPALYYYQEDFSLRLIEWVELLRALGASRLFLYSTSGLHPNVLRVFRHYQAEGFLHITDFHYPPPYVDDSVLRRLWTATERHRMFTLENIYFSDCILRNKDHFRFLAHIDPDELPILLQHESLPHLVAHLAQITAKWARPPPGYSLLWQYFPTDVGGRYAHLGKRFFMLRHDRKMRQPADGMLSNVKALYDTDEATAAISHRAIVCAAGSCRPSHQLSLDLAFMGHFRRPCGSPCQDPLATQEVPRLHSYVQTVSPRVLSVGTKLGLPPQ